MSKTEKPQPKYDTVNSTYFCVIQFYSGNTITGYSLKIGYTEPKDKETCLFNMFIRLLKQGYMRPGPFYNSRGNLIEDVDRIEFYNNQTGAPVYTFYPRFAEPEFEAGLSIRFMEKVEDFYQDWNKGLPFDDLYAKYYISRVRKQKAKFELEKPRFYSMSALTNYCKKLIEEGETPGEVENYKRLYKQKWFGENGTVDPNSMKKYQQEARRSNHADEVNKMTNPYENKARARINNINKGRNL